MMAVGKCDPDTGSLRAMFDVVGILDSTVGEFRHFVESILLNEISASLMSNVVLMGIFWMDGNREGLS